MYAVGTLAPIINQSVKRQESGRDLRSYILTASLGDNISLPKRIRDYAVKRANISQLECAVATAHSSSQAPMHAHKYSHAARVHGAGEVAVDGRVIRYNCA